MTIEQGCTRLEFTNKWGVKLGNSDWIAGVDCDDMWQNEQQDLDEDDESNGKDEDYTPEAETN